MRLHGLLVAVGAICRAHHSGKSDVFSAINYYIHENRLNRCKLVICGDFSVPGIDWLSLSPTGRHKTLCDSLISTTHVFDWTQTVKTPNRESILDLIFIDEQLVKNGYSCLM